MNLTRLLRFAIGLVIAVILLYVILPIVGVPSSEFLPPAVVYNKAQGETRGVVTGKYTVGGNNPFKIGANLYFVNYSFRAHAPAPHGSLQPGPVQTYSGTCRLDSSTYHQYQSAAGDQQSSDNPTPGQVIPLPPYPVKIKYSKSNPVISGIEESWAQQYQMGRSVSPGSNTIGGWMVWIVVALVLAFFIAMLLSLFMKSEEI
jgi:hypothetical protein